MAVTQTKRDEMSFFDSALKGTKYDEFEEDYYEKIFALLNLSDRPNTKVLLDVGCGSGAWGIRLTKKGYDVVGVDISRTLVKSAKDWADTANVNFTPILCDVEKLPLRAGTFEICFCGYVLHHFKRLNKLLFELSRVMKAQSELLAVEPNGSNIINKFGRSAMTFFPQQWVMKKGIATSNERVHGIKYYIRIFKKTGFCTLKFSAVNRETSSAPLRLSLIGLLISGRKLFFSIYQRTTSGPTGKTELLMRASKKSLQKARI
ncbi:MAG: class I SAM-dependent methyltransferase [Candidatus Bathyarchaeia archaeon]|jgi:ubiquinone/menaquinone biosynthesis C-methylase UbiE